LTRGSKLREDGTLELPLHVKQGIVWASRKPTIVYRGANGIGKSKLGVWWAMARARDYPGSRGMIVCSSYKSATKTVEPYIAETLQEWGLGSVAWNRSQTHCLTFPNGALLWVGSADDPKSLEGADLSYAWADEVALWPLASFNVVNTRLRFATDEMIRDGIGPQLLVTYTPWFGGWTREAFAAETDEVQIVHATVFDTPFVADGYIERQRTLFGEGSAWWRRAMLGEEVALEGLVYASFTSANIGPPPEGVRLRYAEGIDWGWIDPTVVLVVAQAPDGRLFLVDEWVQSHATMEETVARCRTNRERYGVVMRFCDPSQPANIVRLQQAGLDAVAAPNAVLPGIGLVNGRFATGRLTIDAGCEETLREIAGYGWQVNSDGEVRRERPQDGSDHCMDSMRYAVGGIDGLGTEVPTQRVTMQEVRPQFTPVAAGMARGGR
jgi:hypothetical protein